MHLPCRLHTHHFSVFFPISISFRTLSIRIGILYHCTVKQKFINLLLIQCRWIWFSLYFRYCICTIISYLRIYPKCAVSFAKVTNTCVAIAIFLYKLCLIFKTISDCFLNSFFTVAYRIIYSIFYL